MSLPLKHMQSRRLVGPSVIATSWLSVLLFFALPALSAADPAQVLVIANTASPVSVEVAEYYIRKRGVPLANLCRIKVSLEERIPRTEYQRLEQAVRVCWQAQRDRFRYALLAPQIPLAIHATPGLSGPQNDQASVDSELALLPQPSLPNRAGPVPNPYFRRRREPFDPRRYPILLVTRLAAQSPSHLRRLIDDSVAAGRDPRLTAKGRVLLDAANEGEAQGNDWLRNAALALPPERVVHETSPRIATGLDQVLGYASWGSNDKSRTERFARLRWLPGSVGTQFVSTDARTFRAPPASWNLGTWQRPESWFAGSPQSLTSDLIAEGATAATGHVAEPYLSATPRPDLLFPAYVVDRFPLAEAYYLSIPFLSWMNVLVGDPLMQLPR